MVVSKGGQVFRDYHHIRGVLGFWLTVFPLVLAKRCGRPVAAIGSQVGPFEERPSRVLARFVLRRLDLLVTRDPISFAEARRLGVASERVRLLPDLAWVLPVPDDDEVEKQLAVNGLDGSRFAIVTIGNTAWTDEGAVFMRNLASLLQRLLVADVIDRVVLAVQTHGPRSSDLELSRRLSELIDDDRAEVRVLDGSPRELMALHRGAAFTIGGRVHSAVMSAASGAPTFPVGRELKSWAIFWGMGMVDWMLPYPDCNRDDVVASIEHRASDLSIRHYIASAAGEQRKALGRMTPLLREAYAAKGE
jgi:polysaccharide pyruvyl transferase WcaK-like protein